MGIEKVAEITGLAEGDERLTLSADENGNLYAIGTDMNFYSLNKSTGEVTFQFEFTELKAQAAVSGATLGSIQSMTYDYDQDVIYWYAHATADTTHIFLYVMVLVAASSLLAGLALARKKHPR